LLKHTLGITSLISIVIMPIPIGLCSGNWVMDLVDDGTLKYIKIFSSVIIGFSLSLIFSFVMTTIFSRFPERDLESEMMWGCVNIFVSGSLGAIFAGIFVAARLSTY
jgi:hypothetical protein